MKSKTKAHRVTSIFGKCLGLDQRRRKNLPAWTKNFDLCIGKPVKLSDGKYEMSDLVEVGDGYYQQINRDQIYYTCQKGLLKGSTIMIRKQDQFKTTNRYCSIILKSDNEDDVIFEKLSASLQKACSEVKCRNFIEAYTFYVTEAKKNSRKFLKAIKLIDEVCPLGSFLKEDITSVIGKTLVEIRKNARVIYQSKRNQSGFFFTLDDEINIKILGLTGNPNTHIQEQAEKIARDHFCKPLTEETNLEQLEIKG